MSRQHPVVDIEFRGFSPYARVRAREQRVNGSTAPSASAPSIGSISASTSTSAGSFRRSSSPVFVSANKVASSSTSLENGLPGNGSQNGLIHYEAPTRNGILSAQIATQLAPHQQKVALSLSDPVYEAPIPRRKEQANHEEVLPPADEPRLRSIFDDGQWGACIWSPSHRIAKTTEAATCQWIVLDEGFGDIERCEKVFTTTESLAKHVLFAHCEPPRRNDFSASVQLLPCAWSVCKYKRFNAAHLKEHVLEHLRPLAYVCPFQECRMSISSHMDSVAALDATYHENGETLRPLGIPKSLKSLVAKHPLPALPKRIPQWLANNQPIGLFIPPRRKVSEEPPEPLAPGAVWPWDLVWTELNKMEPPAIPLSPSALASLLPNQEPPTILINAVPIAIEVSSSPNPHLQVEVEVPARQLPITDYIDLTNDEIEIHPSPPSPKYKPAVDMTALSLAKRDAKRDSNRHRLRPLAGNDTSSQSYSEDSDEGNDTGMQLPEAKRIKLEVNPYGENRMLPR